MWVSDVQKMGAGLTALGTLVMLFGVIMFFDVKLLSFGNLLFLAGLPLIIGINRTLLFFTRPAKIKGSLCFLLGIILILLGWPFLGFSLELFGILGLFGDFIGVILAFLRSLPVLGPILSSPALAPHLDRIANTRILPV